MKTMSHKEELFCDVIMKGGITSGIVYPRAICELAKAYTFKNIGGTSAGAIAAALAAAAEYRRRREKINEGFDKFNEIPMQLSNGGIKNLFKPQWYTWSLYKFALSFIGNTHALLRLLKAGLLLFSLVSNRHFRGCFTRCNRFALPIESYGVTVVAVLPSDYSNHFVSGITGFSYGSCERCHTGNLRHTN
jgi:predicted acylesterase/phospholipase RssA